jgi:hypothetical protein
MARRTDRGAALLLGGFALALAGCSTKPCNTDPARVEAVRAEAQTANATLTDAQRELAAAQARKAELGEQLAGIEDTDAMRARLELLKKGSGR